MTKPGSIAVVGLGPGERSLLTPMALEAIAQAEAVIGYAGYLATIEDLTQGKECIGLALGQEAERARVALARAGAGRRVCVVSSGDAGIYGMASLVFEAAESIAPAAVPDIVVVPGVSALQAAAALLGAPLGHDFAAVSLSDLLTPWPVIEKRVRAAGEADFVLALFNPRSDRRDWQLVRAREILLESRADATPVGIVRHAYRPGQQVRHTTLRDLQTADTDMFTTLIVGNASTRRCRDALLTPRGYPAPGTPEPRS